MFAFDGRNKWTISNYVGTPDAPVFLDMDHQAGQGPTVQSHHAVQITRCSFLNVRFPRKLTQVMLIDSRHCTADIPCLISGVEITNCSDVTVSCKAALPSVAIGNCQSVNVILLDLECSRQTEVTTSSSSSVNVVFPNEKDLSEDVEVNVPEQFVSRLVPDGKGGMKLVTKVADAC